MAEHTLYNKRKLCSTEVLDFTDFQGIGRDPLYKRYDSVYSVVEKHISPEFRDFLAHPVYMEDEDQIFWYVSDWKETPCSFRNLEQGEKERYSAIMHKTITEYQRVKAALNGEDKQILAGALKYIDESMIFCYDGKAVLVAWGMTIDSDKHVAIGSVIRDLAIRNMFNIRFSAGAYGVFENPLADLIKRPEGYVIADTDLPVIVPNEGYECLGWDPDPIGTQVTGHTSFTAKYGRLPEMINVIFQAGEFGELTGEGALRILKGAVLAPDQIPDIQAKDGYEFTGWDYPVDSQLERDIVYHAQYRKLRVSCIFDSGAHGKIDGVASLELPEGTILSVSDIPAVISEKGYKFTGWNISPENYYLNDDVTFVAQYEEHIPWYRRIWPFLKWLLYFLLLLLLLLLCGLLFRNCSCAGHYFGGGGLNDRDSTWIETDPNVGNGGIYNPYAPYEPTPTPPEYKDILPPESGVLPPIEDTPEILPGNPTIIGNRLNILMENTDKSIMEFAKAFKEVYADDAYQVIYYDDVVKRLQIICPSEQRISLKEEIPSRFASDYTLFVFDEALFEGCAVPTDPAFSDLSKTWYLDVINAKAGWDITMGSDRISVAVVDNGFSLRHPELASKVVAPYNVWSHSPDVFPLKEDHGTHVAGTALAIADNSKGMCGLAPNCKFIPVQVADRNNMMTTTTILDGILYALYQGADVVNVSLGTSFAGLDQMGEAIQNELINNHFKEEERLWREVARIAASHKSTIVLAAGNDNVLAGIDALHRPDNFIVVSAIDRGFSDFQKASFSNYGNHSTISAPGVSIYSSVGHNKYTSMDGTSMAAPVVAGTVALMKSLNDTLTTKQIICVLKNTGISVDGSIGNLIQVDKALQMVSSGSYADCRPVPSTGDVQILLSWEGYNDLDLHCTDPYGEMINYNNKFSRSGGRLEIDMNVEYPDSRTPIENIYWPRGGAPEGTYNVYVRHFKHHTGPVATPFKVKVIYGNKTKELEGVLHNVRDVANVFTFTLGNSESSGRRNGGTVPGNNLSPGNGEGIPPRNGADSGDDYDDNISRLERERQRLKNELDRIDEEIRRIRNSR